MGLRFRSKSQILDGTDRRGAAIQTEIDPTIEKQFLAAATDAAGGYRVGLSFSWSPSGNTLYFDLDYRGARNIWRMTINPGDITSDRD
jgi:hypothetical protein